MSFSRLTLQELMDQRKEPPRAFPSFDSGHYPVDYDAAVRRGRVLLMKAMEEAGGPDCLPGYKNAAYYEYAALKEQRSRAADAVYLCTKLAVELANG